MSLAPDTERALEACFEAVVDPSLWPTRLQRLGETLSARSCVVRANGEPHHPDAPRRLQSTGHDAFTELWLACAEEAPDPHSGPDAIPSMRRLCASEVILFDQDLFTAEDRASLPYFRAVARVGRRDWWVGASFRAEGRFWSFNLFRSNEDGPFDRQQGAVLPDLGRHLARLVRLGQEARQANDARLLEGLGHLGLPVVLLAADGSVLGVSEPARALLGPDLDLKQRRLVAPDAAITRRLRLLAQAAVGCVSPIRAVVLLKNGMPWLAAEAWPLPLSLGSRFEGARGAILLRPLEPRPGDAARLIEAFGLTPAEARVAALLGAGLSTGEIGQVTSVGRETVRAHLKAVFRKAGVTGQPQLTALLARLTG
jgi:DNA-binding CsgD family transcriptional regulator